MSHFAIFYVLTFVAFLLVVDVVYRFRLHAQGKIVHNLSHANTSLSLGAMMTDAVHGLEIAELSARVELLLGQLDLAGFNGRAYHLWASKKISKQLGTIAEQTTEIARLNALHVGTLDDLDRFSRHARSFTKAAADVSREAKRLSEIVKSPDATKPQHANHVGFVVQRIKTTAKNVRAELRQVELAGSWHGWSPDPVSIQDDLPDVVSG